MCERCEQSVAESLAQSIVRVRESRGSDLACMAVGAASRVMAEIGARQRRPTLSAASLAMAFGVLPTDEMHINAVRRGAMMMARRMRDGGEEHDTVRLTVLSARGLCRAERMLRRALPHLPVQHRDAVCVLMLDDETSAPRPFPPFGMRDEHIDSFLDSCLEAAGAYDEVGQ